MFSSSNKPPVISVLERHLCSILEGEIQDALPDGYRVTYCNYEPAQRKFRENLGTFNVCAKMEWSISRVKTKEEREREAKGYYVFNHALVISVELANDLNINEVVKYVSNLLCRQTQSRPLNAQRVLENYFNDLIIATPIKPKENEAVFITGKDPKLGSLKRATRLTFSSEKSRWRFFVPYGVEEREIRFYTGKWELGKQVDVKLLTLADHTRLLPIAEKKKPEKLAAKVEQTNMRHKEDVAENALIKKFRSFKR